MRARVVVVLVIAALLGAVAVFVGPWFQTLGKINLVIFFVGVVAIGIFSGVPIGFSFALATFGCPGLSTFTPLDVVDGRTLRDGRNVLACTTRRAVQLSDTDRALPQLAQVWAELLRQVLGAWGLSYFVPLPAGVTVCRVHAERSELGGMETMLKGGQMGAADLFEQLLTGETGCGVIKG